MQRERALPWDFELLVQLLEQAKQARPQEYSGHRLAFPD